ncbi:MAG: superoxide dismutase [Saprospiraceae bacterium]|nr:superoxide dismutase [Saprospiraceae bacterium]
MKFLLPELSYQFDALEPHIDAETMKIHLTKHHQGYTDKLNKAIEGTDLENSSIEEILSKVSHHPAAVRNNAGGFYNHSIFWKILSPNGGDQSIEGSGMKDPIIAKFGSLDSFKEQFTKTALSRFGSGWAWLCMDEPEGSLFITSTPNQDNPLMDVVDKNGIPILGLDVWEHAYYLHYQNRRADYVDAFFKIINWPAVNEYHKKASENAVLV